MKTHPSFSIIAGCALFLVAMGCRNNAGIRPITSRSVVLAFGDSLTYGTGAKPHESYPSVLSRQLGCRVINAGRPGEMTHEGLERLPALLEKEKPALLILCHGGNDLLRKVPRSKTEENMRKMIAMARKRGTDVVLVGVPRPGLILSAADFYGELAEAFQIPYEEDAVPYVLQRLKLKSDQVHPNAEGYRVLAEAIEKVIRKSGGK